MFNIVRLLNLRHLRGQWLRTGLSLLGIIMGVSTFIFAPTLAANIQDSLNATTGDLSGRAEIEIRGEDGGVSPELLPIVHENDGVKRAAPLVMSGGLILGQPELIVFFGIDPALDREVRTYTLADGAFTGAAGEVVIGQSYAQEKGYTLGDSLTLIGAGGLRQVRIVGTLAAGDGVVRLNSGDLMIMNLDDAGALRGSTTFDSISVVPVDGQNLNDLIADLNASLPDNVQVGAPADRLAGAQTFNMLTSLIVSLVAMMVLGLGSMLIYNTMTVTIAQRRAEIGILRALGLLRRDVTRLFVLEALALGLIGSMIGVVSGYLLVSVGATVNMIPEDFVGSSIVRSRADFQVPPWLTILALICGTGISALAGYWPSREAARVDPVEAMVQIRSETGELRFDFRRVALALVLIVVLLLIRYVLAVETQLLTILGTFGIFIALLVIWLVYAPFVVLMGAVLPQFLQRFAGISGMIAAGHLTRRPKRIIGTGLLLTMGLMVSIYIGMSNFGYTEFIDAWDRGENLGDLTVVGAGSTPFKPLIGIPESVVSEISARPDVAGTIVESSTEIEQNGLKYNLRAIDISAFRALGGAFAWDHGDEATAYTRLTQTDRPAVLLGAGFSVILQGLDVGATLTLETPDGQPMDFEVVGVILGGISSESTIVIMDRTLYTQVWGDTQIDRMAVKLTPDADAQTVRRDLLRDYATQGVVAFDNAEMRAAFAKRINSISSVSSLLSSLFGVIVLAGLGSTFYVSVLDRRREIGMLRAVGMLRSQIARTITMEALILSIFALIIGVPGAALANMTQQIALQTMMGIMFAFNFREVVLTLIAVVAVVLVAVYLPARHAARTDILEAMRFE